jgi:putative ABC transport system permease protein
VSGAWGLAWRNLTRRRLRSALTLSGLAVAVAVMACLLAFGQGYEAGLSRELDRMGMQLMIVPLGCPYDAAARILKGRSPAGGLQGRDPGLPAAALAAARRDPDVAVAAPLLMAAVPRPAEGRTDMWVGLDRSALALKPWWRLTSGSHWFQRPDEVILGAEAAAAELRAPGDAFYSPGTARQGKAGTRLRVAGVLERSGTSDDSLFFLPLPTAQAMFGDRSFSSARGRLSAIAIRLKDPTRVADAAARLQQLPGAQVVTLTEMMGTFLNLVGSVRTLVLAIGILAVAISALSVFNTMLAAVLERTAELGVLRAIGASRLAVFRLIALEALLLSLLGGAAGLLLAAGGGRWVEAAVKGFVPLAPADSLLALTGAVMARCLLLSVGAGLTAGCYPAWRASRLAPAEALRGEG